MHAASKPACSAHLSGGCSCRTMPASACRQAASCSMSCCRRGAKGASIGSCFTCAQWEGEEGCQAVLACGCLRRKELPSICKLSYNWHSLSPALPSNQATTSHAPHHRTCSTLPVPVPPLPLLFPRLLLPSTSCESRKMGTEASTLSMWRHRRWARKPGSKGKRRWREGCRGYHSAGGTGQGGVGVHASAYTVRRILLKNKQAANCTPGFS
jgi:hypothetical protein